MSEAPERKPANATAPSDSSRDNVLTSQRFALLEDELSARSRMQTAVAELGQAALTEIDANLLTAQACGLVTDTLRVSYCRVLEYLPIDQRLVTRSLVGAKAQIQSDAVDSEALYAFHSSEPVVFDDLATETRFDGAPVLTSLGVTSGASVTLIGREEVLGVLGAYSTERRVFREYEIEFLRSMANVLAAAVERRRTFVELAETRAQMLRRDRVAHIGSWVWSRGRREWQWSEELYRLLDVRPGSGKTDYATFLSRVHPDDRLEFARTMEHAFSTRGEHTVDHRIYSDSESRTVRTVIQGIFGGDEKPLRIIGLTHDISEAAVAISEKTRLATLIELAAQEWRMTCDAIDAVVLVVDRNGTIVRLNARASQLIDTPFDAALGTILPSTNEPWTTMRQLIAVVSETHIATRADAMEINAAKQWDVSARPLNVAHIHDERIVVVARDVTELANREQVRREADVVDTLITFVGGLVRRAQLPLESLSEVLATDLERIELSGDRLRRVRAAAYDMSELFRILTDYARPFTLDLVPGDVSATVRVAVNTVGAAAAAKQITIEEHLTSSGKILMNQRRLQELVAGILKLFIRRTAQKESILIETHDEKSMSGLWVNLMVSTPQAIFSSKEIEWSIDPNTPDFDETQVARLAVIRRILDEHGGTMLLSHRIEDLTSVIRVRFPMFSR